MKKALEPYQLIERSLYQSQMALVNLVAQQYINYVTLCKALGGGWTAAIKNEE